MHQTVKDDYYFILEILLNEDDANTSVLCQYPFLIDWNPYNYMWQPLSIQMSQLPLLLTHTKTNLKIARGY